MNGIHSDRLLFTLPPYCCDACKPFFIITDCFIALAVCSCTCIDHARRDFGYLILKVIIRCNFELLLTPEDEAFGIPE